jgi:hypothetical protein
MPIRLPEDRRAKTKTLKCIEALDWLTVWSISVGVCAMFLAGMVYLAEADHVGAAFILISGAIVMAIASVGAPPRADN